MRGATIMEAAPRTLPFETAPGAERASLVCTAADDTELVRLARQQNRLRLRLGELFDALYEDDGHHALGFSSFAGYGVERAGRSERWCHDTRRLARRIRLRQLASVRQAMLSGRLSWSMAEVLVRVATANCEHRLLEEASSRTVRQMKALCKGSGELDDKDAPPVRASRAVGAPERLMVEMSRMVVEHIEGRRIDDEVFLTALLGEAQSTLHELGARPIAGVVVPEVDAKAVRALDEMKHRVDAHHQSGPDPAPVVDPEATQTLGEAGIGRFVGPLDDPSSRPSSCRSNPSEQVTHGIAVADDPPLPRDVEGIDREIRRCVRQMAERDLRIGRLARSMIGRGGWWALGYATREQYATERVGLSLSSLEQRATLARRAEKQPALADALVSGKISYEAALAISRIPNLGPVMAKLWVDRARRRTVLHLREEVNAVRLRWSLDNAASCAPPDDAALAEIAELERKIQTGELFSSLLGTARLRPPQTFVTLPAGTGCEVRFCVSADVRAHLSEVEAQFRNLAGPKASFVAFMCICLWDAWLPWLEARDDKWAAVFRRDRHRCSNPVCDRTDITPHHLEFRADGGGDEDENIATLCAWCHLQGVHGDRIVALPPASNIHWWIGRTPVLEIRGREVLARAA